MKKWIKIWSDVKKLQAEYESIEIVTTYQESTFEVIDGVMVIKDNSTSEIKITDQNIQNINELVGSIRNKIIS